jgi:regulator of sigma E protease
MILLAIDWSAVGLQAAQLLLSLSILVILHEFGHFITARWFGCRVEKFYLFFDPWFSLFKKKKGETEYGVGWLPLGGYVKIAGMIDESMDKEALSKPAQPWEFRSKPAWQRLIIMVGGVVMNVLVAFVIYAFVLIIWGDKKIPTSSMKYGVHVVDSTLYKMGIRNGDRILTIDNQPVNDFEKLRRKLILGEQVQLQRGEELITIKLDKDLIGQLVENRNKDRRGFLEARRPAIVYFVPDTGAAYKAGLRPGDKMLAIENNRFEFYDQLQEQLPLYKGDTINLMVQRNDQEVALQLPINEEGKIGFLAYGYNYQQMDSLGWIKLEVNRLPFFAAIPGGIKKAGTELQDYIDQFKKILDPDTGAYKGVGGFKSMGSIFPGSVWDWEAFWRITAFLSIVLAFMNLLPIPALDGGHVLFTLYEMVSGRKPSDKFLEYAQLVGMALLLSLMIYANANDWLGWGK